ncbi:putative GEM-like protein 8 [Typha latifolia]|uniref:putative GEM-like protein 8 n=1 Tax=Typha latifolia TaxID=4733 RepID=UPI003C2F8C13
MEKTSHDQAIGIPINTVGCASELPKEIALPESSPYLQLTSYGSSQVEQRKVDSIIHWINKMSNKADSCVRRLRDHVSLGPNISKTVKGKLRLSARILQAGGIERVFRQKFTVRKGEKLLNAFQCYLSTTTGPIAGLLFISTDKIAFHSDRTITVTSPKGNLAKVPYKVLIPLRRIEQACERENLDKPNQKYIQIVTVDKCECWFMGFISPKRSFKYLQQAIFEVQERLSE